MASPAAYDWQHSLYHADEDDIFAVIGGEGFLGGALLAALRRAYPSHSSFSLGLTRRSSSPDHFRRADITDPASILAALRDTKATTVFHTASPHAIASREVCERVNVRGTEAVVAACRAAGVRKLVFSSSISVVFEGSDLIDVDERMPVTESQEDPYVASKVRAERIALAANGQDGLLTCSLRLAGIFGPGDRQAIPGLIQVVNSGQTSFQVGPGRALFDWVHTTNAVHAHLLAAAQLSRPPVDSSVFATRLRPVNLSIPSRPPPTSVSLAASSTTPAIPLLPARRTRFDPYCAPIPAAQLVLAGQSVVITNGEPLSFWSFAQAVWFAYAGHVPPFVIPLPAPLAMALAHFLVFLVGIANLVTGRSDKPILSPERVRYSTSNIYFNIEKARRVLGYEPVISLEDGIKDAVDWFKAEEAKEKARLTTSKKDI